MTMKVLLDAVVTARPDRCSTTIQFYNIIKHVLFDEERTDIFFYWLVPDWAIEEGKGYYPEHPNIKYVPVKQKHDRTYETIHLRESIVDQMAFYGYLWDSDVIITTRSGATPLIRMIATTPKDWKNARLKRQVWLVDEMPMFKFKSTVLQFGNGINVPNVLTGYLAADRVWLVSQHEKKFIVNEAREHLPPSKVREIEAKIENIIPAAVEEAKLKDPKYFPHKNGNPFCIGFAGRMAKSNNLKKTEDVMLKQFITKGTKVKLLISTQSRMNQAFRNKELFEVKNAGREEFWKMAREQMHVIINQPVEGGYSLSVMEPLFLGTPVVVPKAHWAETILGPDYPFFATSESEIYARINMFWSNYEKEYEKFADWWENWLVPHYEKVFEECLLEKKALRAFDEYNESKLTEFKERFPNSLKDVVQLIANEMGDENTIPEAFRILGERNEIVEYKDKEKELRFHKVDMVYQPDWMRIRLLLKTLYGYEDASTDLGHLRKVKDT